MRKHEYFSDKTYDHDKLMLSAVDHWVQYAEKRMHSVKFNTKYIDWHCYKCKSPIKVHYATNSVKSMYCERCKPERLLHIDAIQVRYLAAFKAHVRNLIITNSGINTYEE